MRAMIVMMGLVLAGGAHGETLHEQKRRLYAMATAAPEWCPNIETRWFTRGAIDYDLNASDGEYDLFDAERREWLRTFRQAGSRAAVCEAIMLQYGPGAELELFQYR